MKQIMLIAFMLLSALFLRAAAADPFQYSWQEIAPGVHVGIRDDSTRAPVMGTTTVVVSTEGVVVFDGGGVPLMSERAIEYIRGITDKPVTHVAVSHWHQDHFWGIAAFADAYPGVRIVSHPYTREQLTRRNPAAEERSATAIARLIPSVTTQLENPELGAADRARLETLLADADVIDGEYQRLRSAYPDTTFERKLVIHSGERTIEFLHLGRGNTAGDIVMWLPTERIVAAGDLVVRPTPYGFGSYPGEWAETLRALQALDFRILVPGHGDIQHDAEYVALLSETLDLVATQMAALVAEGLDEDAAVGALDFSSVEQRFTNDDALLAGRFAAWFKRPIGLAAYQVATGQSPEVAE
jgi:cyclase